MFVLHARGERNIVTRPLHFGVTLPQIKRSWSEARAAAVEFDELGYDSVWVCDHVYGVPLPTLPIFEAWTELAAVAAVTERVQLGTLVTPPFFRNPGVLAKQIATVDHVAGGRVIVGLGAGWFQPEFEGYGLPFPALGERMAALDELAQILPRLFSDERTTFEGRHFQLRDAICEPKPPRRPPLLIGGGGERVLMGIAARHADIWNNLAVFQPQLEQKIESRVTPPPSRSPSNASSSSPPTTTVRARHSRRPRRSTVATWALAWRSTASGEIRKA
jgi:alkanesulfonate monooxygenase SsuD/methylene tetrahydromethanopterin reductase-like flavin-dependent oxidoreductase (luciferase family)